MSPPNLCQSHPASPESTTRRADVRNRLSLPVREGSNDPAPLVGVRASPSGRYLLVLFRRGSGHHASAAHRAAVYEFYACLHWLACVKTGVGCSALGMRMRWKAHLC